MKKFAPLMRFFSFVAATAFGVAGIWIETIREDIPERAGETIEISVAPGRSAAETADEFERAGLVTDAGSLVKWMIRGGIDKKIKPGKYRIAAGRAKDVALQLASARPDVPLATILPGAVFEEAAAAAGGEDAAASFELALGAAENFPADLRPLLPASARERIVFLAPDTYALKPGEGAAEALVSYASDLWWKRHGEKLPKGITSADLANEGILASIIQKEALVDSDRPVIAGVLKNRLRNGMPLQVDATVVYAWRLKGVKVTAVSYNDLKIDSPFNTYLHKGLPPENIGIPSESSWNAALQPAETDMMFYFAGPGGEHIFTRTYKEHLEAQKKMRK
jgi:UPF0755 protein